MTSTSTSGELPAAAPRSPFERLNALLAGREPGAEPINMTVGEPRHAFPPMVTDILVREAADFGRYPPARGTEVFRNSAGAWLNERFGLGGAIEADRHLIPLAGSREGLFTACFVATERARRKGRNGLSILMPNPFYQTYAAGALAAGAEPVFLDTTSETGHLPDLEAIPPETLRAAAAVFLCSPANPQGAVASNDYLERLVGLAAEHGFLVFSDECYSEVYRDIPPTSALFASLSSGFANVLVFNSLSKRSNLPGLRVGLAAGDPDLIDAFAALRNVAAATVPRPVQAAAAAVWGDERHVAENRRLYNEKFSRVERILGDRYGYRTPAGGFFVWLDVAAFGGGEAAAGMLWEQAGVRVLPGAYLSAGSAPDGARTGPGHDHIRVALVGPAEEIEEGFTRLRAVLE